MQNESKTPPFALILGALTVGAVVGLLFAPKPGEELRDDIRDTLLKNRDKVRGLARKIGDKIPALKLVAKDAAVEALREANAKAVEVLGA